MRLELEGQLVSPEQSRADWFTLILIKIKGDFSEIHLGASKVLLLDISIFPSLKLDVACFIRK